MFRSSLIGLLLILIGNFSNGQKISGRLSLEKGNVIKVYGFNGLQSYLISNNKIDSNGIFSLSYNLSDTGVGYITIERSKPFLLILSGEDIEISGKSISETETVRILKGSDNLRYSKYAYENPRSEKALSAWNFLQQIYSDDSLFKTSTNVTQFILAEKERLLKNKKSYFTNSPSENYLRWYTSTRHLISEVANIAQYRQNEIPKSISAFRSIDYTDKKLYKSGLLKDAIESHFWLLENCGQSLDSIYYEMKISIDSLLFYLIKDEKILNEVTDYLFDLLERHSLFDASEYLALKVLNQVGCNLNNNLARQLETYRIMKKGNIAPDFNFSPKTYYSKDSNKEVVKKLTDLKSRYTLIVFGASDCPKCKLEIPSIAPLYSKWKSFGIEVVFVSLDQREQEFDQFVKDLPFISTCDFKSWNGSIVEHYYVFATPTLFLLDSNRKILLRPNSIKQMDSWVDFYLKNKFQEIK